jgi:hypothetical protein
VAPFSVSFALSALARSKRPDNGFFYRLLKQYASSHRLNPTDPSTPLWIDENMNPDTGDWISRTRLSLWSDSGGWDKGKGDEERGKDYNHSTFCDIVISGLFGVKVVNKKLSAKPLFPKNWESASLRRIPFAGKLWRVDYGKSGVKITEDK